MKDIMDVVDGPEEIAGTWKKFICECGSGLYYKRDGTEYCPNCQAKIPGFALILHPEVVYRDPYGVLSRESLRHVCRYAEVWKRGWDDCVTLNRCGEFAGYWRVLDYLHGLVDLPLYLKQQIALFLTRDNPNILDPFNPVL
jgi:hypothetical protein